MGKGVNPNAVSIILVLCAAGGAIFAQGEPPKLSGIGFALAGESSAKTGQNGEAAAAARAITQYEGVYKRRFQNGDITGRKYTSEDILEIVRYGDEKVYLRTELEFFNGHQCSLYGIAKYEDGAFHFTEPKPIVQGEPPCTLKITLGRDAVVFSDAGNSCKAYCGARGILEGASFPYKAKRRIRYMERLKKFRQREEAVRDFEEKAKEK